MEFRSFSRSSAAAHAAKVRTRAVEVRTDVYFVWNERWGVKLRGERSLELKVLRHRDERGREQWVKMALACQGDSWREVCEALEAAKRVETKEVAESMAATGEKGVARVRVDKARSEVGRMEHATMRVEMPEGEEHYYESWCLEGNAKAFLPEDEEKVASGEIVASYPGFLHRLVKQKQEKGEGQEKGEEIELKKLKSGECEKM